MKKQKYIVENSSSGYETYWLSGFRGDNGRTLFPHLAKVFSSKESAQKAIDKAIKKNAHGNFGNNFSIIIHSTK